MLEDNKAERMIERLAFSSLAEQRARRRWGVFFRLLIFAYIAAIAALYFWQPERGVFAIDGGEHAAVVNLYGEISAGGASSAAIVNHNLRRAFENENAKGVILRINSPGGSPVESGRIYKELRRLRVLHPGKKVYAVIGDFGASGGYYAAAGADEIYVDESSLVGSIGVIYSAFGFTGAMEKLGVDRRVITAGNDKSMLDPFLPQSEEDTQRLQKILSSIRETFVTAVREGRGERLPASSDAEVFTGAIFDGKRSVELGLADGIGDTGYVAREIIGVDFTTEYTEGAEDDWRTLLRRLTGTNSQMPGIKIR